MYCMRKFNLSLTVIFAPCTAEMVSQESLGQFLAVTEFVDPVEARVVRRSVGAGPGTVAMTGNEGRIFGPVSMNSVK